ncbi:MAG TPA: BON domain-containing protein [Paraburkholderia sp.]|jgi:osmotically-inducible protein OsmY
MKANDTRKLIVAMFAGAIAVCAAFANAQTSTGAPDAASSETEAAAPSQGSRSDSALVRDVRRAFTRTTGLNPSNIHVTARDGVVTLTGSVPRDSQIQRAGDAAKSVRGVTEVSNKLTLRTSRGSGP